uniref:Protein BatD n=1 Tax=candidate division WOR-3 bacterium TaxID=2052148 RepID=A0A7C6EJ10_UNCW3
MILLLWFIFSQFEAKADLAKGSINKKLTIGDPFEILIEVSIPANKNISEPFIDSIEPFAIIKQKHKIIQEKGKAKHSYRLQVSAFNIGELKFPPVKFLLREGSKTDTIQTNPVDIKITGTLPQGMKDINDIKEMIDFPNPLPVIILIIVICAGVIAFLGIKFYKKLKQKRILTEEKIPCWTRALNAIDSLLKEDFIKKGMIKKFYYTLTEILKRYLEERFQFPAVEQTTTEIFHSMKSLKIPLREDFQHIFSYADMVKYAKFIPPQDATDSIVNKAKELILKTVPEDKGEKE